MNKLEDIELFNKFKNGDISAFEKLYNRYSNTMKAIVYQIVKDEDVSEEIVQDTFLQILNHPEKFKEEKDFKNFIFKVARNRALNWYNKNMNRNKIMDENEANIYNQNNQESILNTLERKEDKTELEKAMDMLKPEYKEAINLVDFQEMSYSDAARKMNKTENQFKVTLHRARKSLEDKIEKFFPELERKYRKVKKIQILLISIFVATLLTGLVYATIMIYKYVTKKDETYTLEEVYSTVDESLAKIKREEAKTIIGNYLDILGIKDYDLDKIELKKDGKEDIIHWQLVTEQYQININAESGEIIRFNNFENTDNFKDNSNVKIEEYDVDKIIGQTDKILIDLKLQDNYNYQSIDKYELDSGFIIYYVSYSTTYNKNTNSYKIALIGYLPQLNIIKDINVYEYKFDENNIKFSKEDAIKIIEEKYNNIKIDKIELCAVRITNTDNWKQKNWNYENTEKEELYSKMYNVKLVWSIDTKINNSAKILYLDVNTGEITEETASYEINTTR